MKILVLGGSIRASANNSELIQSLGTASEGIEQFKRNAADMIESGHRFSNSEIMAGAAISGATALGAEVDYFSLVQLFPRKDINVFEQRLKGLGDPMGELDYLSVNSTVLQQLLDRLDQSQGVILSTPVYFGDRSSVANKFLQITAVRNMLRDKIFAMVSVGAKRNGGQETTNIFGLFEALNQDALVVGNGPPTSQYGGTAVGGNQGHVLDDDWGLKTVMGTGRKVTHATEVFSLGTTLPVDGPVNICILVTIDTKERTLRRYLDSLVAKVRREHPWVRFTILELIDHSIYRCLGCTTCPQEKDVPGVRAHCIINDPTDYMETVRSELLRSDGAIVAGLNILQAEKMIFRYQVTTERMRFMRRNNFELTNLLMTGLCYNQLGARMTPVHSMKVVTSYLRQNAILHRSIDILEHEGRILNSGQDVLERFCRNARYIKAGKCQVRQLEQTYEPHGEGSGYARERWNPRLATSQNVKKETADGYR